jgi:hypothetical protein
LDEKGYHINCIIRNRIATETPPPFAVKSLSPRPSELNLMFPHTGSKPCYCGDPEIQVGDAARWRQAWN